MVWIWLGVVIALILNKIMKPLINLMTEKWKFNYKVSVIISVILVIAVLGIVSFVNYKRIG